MHQFTVGEVVVCIDDILLCPFPSGQVAFSPKLGACYRVSELVADRWDNPGVRLEGVRDHPSVYGWHAWRFRRLDAADAAFTRLLREIASKGASSEPWQADEPTQPEVECDDWNREETEEDAIRAAAISRLQERHRARPRPWYSSGVSPTQMPEHVKAVGVTGLSAHTAGVDPKTNSVE
jgi:hypothetical protein